MVRGRGRAVRGSRHPRRLRDHRDARVRVPGPRPGLHRDHRDRRHPRPHRRGRRGREAADADADGRERLRRLRQRFRPDRHPLALPAGAQPHRLDGGRRGLRDEPDARSGGLHRAAVRHRARRQGLPAPRPAVREPLLVPLRLVQRREEPGRLPGGVRLRSRRPRDLVGLRGHRGVLHRSRPQPHGRRRPRLRPHGLRQEGSLARLALHGRLDVDGRHGRPGGAQRLPDRRVGHPRQRRLPAGGLVHGARRGDQLPRGGLRDPEVSRLARRLRPARGRGHDVLGVGPGAGAGQRRPADVLVQRPSPPTW